MTLELAPYFMLLNTDTCVETHGWKIVKTPSDPSSGIIVV